MSKTTKEFDYIKAHAELNDLLDWFESGSTDLDVALTKYARAEALISQMESYLTDTEAQLKIHVQKSQK